MTTELASMYIPQFFGGYHSHSSSPTPPIAEPCADFAQGASGLKNENSSGILHNSRLKRVNKSELYNSYLTELIDYTNKNQEIDCETLLEKSRGKIGESEPEVNRFRC